MEKPSSKEPIPFIRRLYRRNRKTSEKEIEEAEENFRRFIALGVAIAKRRAHKMEERQEKEETRTGEGL